MADNKKPIMAYCVKCKAKKNIVEAEEVTMKNGKKAINAKTIAVIIHS